eukprot:2428151-Prymnesium_polylepis.2
MPTHAGTPAISAKCACLEWRRGRVHSATGNERMPSGAMSTSEANGSRGAREQPEEPTHSIVIGTHTPPDR